MPTIKTLLLASLVLGVAAAIALAAPDRTGTVSVSTSYKWQGKALNGAIATSVDGADPCTDPSQCDFTLLNMTEGGQLTVHIKGDPNGAPADPTDIDLTLYASDASGKQGNVLKASAGSTAEESVTYQTKTGGYFLARVAPAVATNATFKGEATVGALPPDPPNIDFGPDPAPGPGQGVQTSSDTGGAGSDFAPSTKVSKPRKRPVRTLSGSASDADGKVAYVDVALVRVSGKTCRWLDGRGAFAKGSCKTPKFVRAHGTKAWHLALKHLLGKGSYRLLARATDDVGRIDAGFGPANAVAFRVK